MMPTDHDHTPEGIADRLAVNPPPSYLKDGIYGAIDGAVTTFAVVSGVAGAGLASEIIIVLGVANLVGDGFSMAASNFLGTRAENQEVDRALSIEQRHIRDHPEGEREEVRQILAAEGFEGDLLERAVTAVTRSERHWLAVMLRGEYGIAGRKKPPLPAAATTFVCFVVVGAIPLAPFVLALAVTPPVEPFLLSSLLTGGAFFVVGAVKARFVLQPWIASALETLLVGSTAAALAYLCGYLLRGLV